MLDHSYFVCCHNPLFLQCGCTHAPLGREEEEAVVPAAAVVGGGSKRKRAGAQKGVDAILDLGPVDRGDDEGDEEEESADPFGEFVGRVLQSTCVILRKGKKKYGKLSREERNMGHFRGDVLCVLFFSRFVQTISPVQVVAPPGVFRNCLMM